MVNVVPHRVVVVQVVGQRVGPRKVVVVVVRPFRLVGQRLVRLVTVVVQPVETSPDDRFRADLLLQVRLPLALLEALQFTFQNK